MVRQHGRSDEANGSPARDEDTVVGQRVNVLGFDVHD